MKWEPSPGTSWKPDNSRAPVRVRRYLFSATQTGTTAAAGALDSGLSSNCLMKATEKCFEVSLTQD